MLSNDAGTRRSANCGSSSALTGGGVAHEEVRGEADVLDVAVEPHAQLASDVDRREVLLAYERDDALGNERADLASCFGCVAAAVEPGE